MSTSRPAHDRDDQQAMELMVAYLDGELSPEESSLVEKRLATDQRFRKQLQGFERAWSALDALPSETVGDNFSKTTMALVVDAARDDLKQQTVALPVQRRKLSRLTALAAVVGILLGVLVVRLVAGIRLRRIG